MNKRKFLLCTTIIVCIVTIFALAACSSTGTDNEKDNVKVNINSVEDFLKMAKQQSQIGTLNEGDKEPKYKGLDSVIYSQSTATNITYTLQTDIDLSGYPITIESGNTDVYPSIIQTLYATFEGNNKTIKNLSITINEGASATNVGLIGEMMGKIRNLTFDNCVITSNGSISKAGLAAGNNRGMISNIKTNSNCSITSTSGSVVGGISGGSSYKTSKILAATPAAQSITGCTNNATININGGNTIGGIAGSYTVSRGKLNGGYTRELSNNTNNAAITGSSNVGGIVGSAEAADLEVKNNVNNGKITGYNELGGILGTLSININGTRTKGEFSNLVMTNNTNNASIVPTSYVVNYETNETAYNQLYRCGGIVASLTVTGDINTCSITNNNFGSASKTDVKIENACNYIGGIFGSFSISEVKWEAGKQQYTISNNGVYGNIELCQDEGVDNTYVAAGIGSYNPNNYSVSITEGHNATNYPYKVQVA